MDDSVFEPTVGSSTTTPNHDNRPQVAKINGLTNLKLTIWYISKELHIIFVPFHAMHCFILGYYITIFLSDYKIHYFIVKKV